MELKNGYKFKKIEIEDFDDAYVGTSLDDSAWREVRVPHDWGIEGDFSADNDPSESSIIEDGIRKPITLTGRTGGLPILGAGIYRKWVRIKKSDRVFLELDGVMWFSRIYVNGRLAGSNHFGYKSFSVDITEHVKFGTDNLIAVYAEVKADCGRWYCGGGIFRNVRLVSKPEGHFAYNGIWCRQIYADKRLAIIDVSAETVNAAGFRVDITSPDGRTYTAETSEASALIRIEDPCLWDIDSPLLYTATLTLENGYSESVRFGIRKCEFTKKGFFLNDRYVKLNGVCMHHDLGAIGAAVNVRALRRQIEIMKEMGVNSWRTSHNPPAPELLELCDEMGILVMDEFFDEWRLPKVKNGYSASFDEFGVSDALDIIRRDRNHPSVIMWSIGNEVREQIDKDGWRVAKMLYDAVKAFDPTRAITNGLCHYPACYDLNLAFFTDVVGLNYKPHTYGYDLENYPERPIVGSETESCISSRGVYHFPAEITIGLDPKEDLAISDYGLVAPPWAYFAERELAAQQDYPEIMGEYIWTGFDYLGEPTPYYSQWPSRSSYFGVVDMAGLPKNRYYLYKSVWTDIPTLHVFPHWNWEERVGENVPVHIYTNFDEVELFVNGVSYGRRTFAVKKTEFASEDEENANQLERFRLMWNDVIYQPGEITAVAYKDGVEAMRRTVKTAGEPYRIRLTSYVGQINADGEDINYVTAEILDRDGNICPRATDRITFETEGAAEVYATDAGDQRETETFLRPDKRAMSGMVVAILRSNGEKGRVTVTARADGLVSGSTEFECV